jgi:hypothetical protein
MRRGRLVCGYSLGFKAISQLRSDVSIGEALELRRPTGIPSKSSMGADSQIPMVAGEGLARRVGREEEVARAALARIK